MIKKTVYGWVGKADFKAASDNSDLMHFVTVPGGECTLRFRYKIHRTRRKKYNWPAEQWPPIKVKVSISNGKAKMTRARSNGWPTLAGIAYAN